MRPAPTPPSSSRHVLEGRGLRPGGRSLLGAYDVLHRVGARATTEIVVAVERGPFGFQRTVVLERLLPGLPAEERAQAIADLAAQARAYARVAHPAMVRLYELAVDGDLPVVVMEHVEGVSLARAMLHARARAERLDMASALYVGYRIFLALAAAHAARDPVTHERAPVVHRSVCPANVVVPWDGYVKLADLGTTGTSGYLSPEQVHGKSVDVRSDVYAGCLVLRELLLGASAFELGERTHAELLAAIANPALGTLAELLPGLPASVGEAVDRGLARDPRRRNVSAEELADVLRRATDLEEARALWVERIREVRLVEEALSRSATRAVARSPLTRPPLVVATPGAMTTATRSGASVPVRRPSLLLPAVAVVVMGGMIGAALGVRQRLIAKAAEARAPHAVSSASPGAMAPPPESSWDASAEAAAPGTRAPFDRFERRDRIFAPVDREGAR